MLSTACDWGPLGPSLGVACRPDDQSFLIAAIFLLKSRCQLCPFALWQEEEAARHTARPALPGSDQAPPPGKEEVGHDPSDWLFPDRVSSTFCPLNTCSPYRHDQQEDTTAVELLMLPPAPPPAAPLTAQQRTSLTSSPTAFPFNSSRRYYIPDPLLPTGTSPCIWVCQPAAPPLAAVPQSCYQASQALHATPCFFVGEGACTWSDHALHGSWTHLTWGAASVSPCFSPI